MQKWHISIMCISFAYWFIMEQKAIKKIIISDVLFLSHYHVKWPHEHCDCFLLLLCLFLFFFSLYCCFYGVFVLVLCFEMRLNNNQCAKTKRKIAKLTAKQKSKITINDRNKLIHDSSCIDQSSSLKKINFAHAVDFRNYFLNVWYSIEKDNVDFQHLYCLTICINYWVSEPINWIV